MHTQAGAKYIVFWYTMTPKEMGNTGGSRSSKSTTFTEIWVKAKHGWTCLFYVISQHKRKDHIVHVVEKELSNLTKSLDLKAGLIWCHSYHDDNVHGN